MDTSHAANQTAPDAILPDGDPMKLYRQLKGEYDTTVRVVAVLVERLLVATGGVLITITDAALGQAPDLDARRNEARRAVLLRTSR